MRKTLFILLAISFIFHRGNAQQFGGTPPSVKWMQINTDSLRVIFPKGFEHQAQQVANTAMYINRHERASIGDKEVKLNIVLQNKTIISNGFVALSPFRSVFQTTPPSDNFSLGSMNWLNELSLHEYRHALQNMNFRSGIGKTFYEFFGDNGQALVTNLLIPDWFWEGDAVFMETALSKQGRGRLPSFLEPFKSLYYAGKNYPYAKIRNGSFRDLVPNHYPLGYMMTAYGRDTLGLHFWKNVTQESLLNGKAIKKLNAQNPQDPYRLFKYGFYPMSAVLHYRTGTKIKGFYKNTLYHFSKQWETARDTMTMTPINTIKQNSTGSVLNYRYPHLLPDGNLLAVKYGYAHTPRIIRIDSLGNETLIVKMGNLQDVYFSYAKNKITWAEYRPDARWGWVNYSVIRVYDRQTKRTQTISHKSRFFSPSLSPDGKKIVVVSVSPDMQYRLLLLDATNGNILKTFSNANRYEYTYPVFDPSGNSIITEVRDTSGRMAFAKFNIGEDQLHKLTPFILKPLGPPVVTGTYIYFPAGLNNNVQLYALRRTDNRLFRIAERPLGNYSVAIDTTGNRIFFDEFSASGYRLQEVTADTNTWKAISWQKAEMIHDPYVPKALKAEGGNILNKIPDKSYATSPYRGIQRLFKVHSWSFLPDFPEIGLYLQSQNLLETLQINAGGGYDLNEKTPFIAAYALFGQWFPFLRAGYKKTFGRSSYIGDTTLVTWNESNTYAGFDIPLNLSGSLYNRSLTVGGTLNLNSLHFKNNPLLKTTDRKVTYSDVHLTFSNTHIMPYQGIYPKFGQSISLRYRRTLSNLYAYQFTSGLNLFFPGLFQNHSFYITSAYAQKDRQKDYKFSDDFNYPAGYNAVPYYKIYKVGFNYQFPLAYPDWGLTWAYLLRVRLNLSFEYSHADMLPALKPKEATYRSAGAVIFLDTKLFSSVSVPIGLRYSYLLDKDYQYPNKKYAVQITFPITF